MDDKLYIFAPETLCYSIKQRFNLSLAPLSNRRGFFFVMWRAASPAECPNTIFYCG